MYNHRWFLYLFRQIAYVGFRISGTVWSVDADVLTARATCTHFRNLALWALRGYRTVCTRNPFEGCTNPSGLGLGGRICGSNIIIIIRLLRRLAIFFSWILYFFFVIVYFCYKYAVVIFKLLRYWWTGKFLREQYVKL